MPYDGSENYDRVGITSGLTDISAHGELAESPVVFYMLWGVFVKEGKENR